MRFRNRDDKSKSNFLLKTNSEDLFLKLTIENDSFM